MVFFSCDGCAEMLKKNQVDGHARKCRRCVSVSCVDCNVSFYGDDFRAHTSCVTEVERYEKKSTSASHKQGQQRAKVTPQQSWMDLIVEAVATAPPHIRPYLSTMSTLDNVPRKAKAFTNFTANSLNLRGKGGASTVTEIWTHLNELRDQKQKQKPDAPSTAEKVTSASPRSDAATEAKHNDQLGLTDAINNPRWETPRRPMKQSGASPANQTDQSATLPQKKTVKKAIRLCLKATVNQSLTFKELQTLVRKRVGAASTDDRVQLRQLVRHTVRKNGKTFVLHGKTVSLMIKPNVE